MATASALLNEMEEVRFSDSSVAGLMKRSSQTRGACPPPPIFSSQTKKKGGQDKMTRRIAYSVLALSFWVLLIITAMSGRV